MAVPIGFTRRWARGSAKGLNALLDFVGMTGDEKRDWLQKARDKIEAEKAVDLKSWRLRLVCCGRDAGEEFFATWEEADRFRESYTSGPGVDGGGHDRAAILEKR